MKLSANGISRRLRAAGHTRHTPGREGYQVTSSAHGASVHVWHVSSYGGPLPPSPRLQAYGRTLAEHGYTVHVTDDMCLNITAPTNGAA